MKSQVRNLLRKAGFDIVRAKPDRDENLEGVEDLSVEQRRILEDCRSATMTSPARMASLMNALNHITKNEIPGDIAECGVWRGGSIMIVARALIAAGDMERSLYLYDTFEGMSEPTEADAHAGEMARDRFDRIAEANGTWCFASLEEVRENVLSTGYPEEKIHFIKGKVEDTIPGTLPESLALLRLDTDWYESTKHELEHLYPLLAESGVLILDDYGYWDGARKAVDEYFEAFSNPPFLHRIDRSGRMIVNPSRASAFTS